MCTLMNLTEPWFCDGTRGKGAETLAFFKQMNLVNHKNTIYARARARKTGQQQKFKPYFMQNKVHKVHKVKKDIIKTDTYTMNLYEKKVHARFIKVHCLPFLIFLLVRGGRA